MWTGLVSTSPSFFFNLLIMFNTKNLVHSINHVPVSWIFEYYCQLKNRLTGQDIRMKSLFNPKEKTNSMFIFFKDKTYRFKDFSSGLGGSAVELVKQLFNLTYHGACQKIIEDYNEFILHNNGGYDVKDFKEASKYKVNSFKLREWNTQDKYFWTQFNIGSKLLEEYEVKPLESYTMVNGDKTLTINGNYIYGYFNKGELYKIYQPKIRDKKFIKVKSFLQGSNQLKKKKYLVICSSLKDAMSVLSLKLDLDVIAPDSENTMLPEDVMKSFLSQYKEVIVLFDFDDSGLKSLAKYKAKYPKIKTAILQMSKDVSDSIKDFGYLEVKTRLTILLNYCINTPIFAFKEC